jgi:hypothetical protein
LQLLEHPDAPSLGGLCSMHGVSLLLEFCQEGGETDHPMTQVQRDAAKVTDQLVGSALGIDAHLIK